MLRKKQNNWEEKFFDPDPVVRENLAEHLGQLKDDLKAHTFLIRLLNDKNNFVRSAALKSVMQIGKKKYFLKILPLLQDMDEIVRIDAIECLASLGKEKAVKYLLKYCNDSSSLVRGYVGSIIGEIGDKSHITHLEMRLEVERLGVSKVGLLDGLYRLGQEDRLIEIIDCFKSRRYQVRCCVANTLASIINKKNKNIIRKALKDELENEKTIAVRSSINNAIKILKLHKKGMK